MSCVTTFVTGARHRPFALNQNNELPMGIRGADLVF